MQSEGGGGKKGPKIAVILNVWPLIAKSTHYCASCGTDNLILKRIEKYQKKICQMACMHVEKLKITLWKKQYNITEEVDKAL